MHRAPARVALVEHPRPHARAVSRVREQPRHRRRRDLDWRRRAAATAPPARPPDDAAVGAHLDLEKRRLVGAVRHIGLPARCAGACLGRRVVHFHPLLDPGAWRAAVSARARLLAATAAGARRLQLLAAPPEQRLRQHRRGRAQLRKLRFQRPDPALRYLRPPPQPGVLLLQRIERGRLMPRPAQGLVQPPDLGRLDLRPRHRLAQPLHLHAQRHDRAAPARVDASLPQQPGQARHLGLKEQGALRDAAHTLGLLVRLLPLAPGRLEPRLVQTRLATGGRLRPLQLVRTCFGIFSPLERLLVQQPPVRLGGRADFLVPMRHGAPP